MMNRPLSELNFIEGEVLLFDKPIDWTSFDVVRKIRSKIYHHLEKTKIKVGHAGTLDPKASGLIIVCTGRKTKEIEKIQAGEKEYIAEIYLGATRPSFDLETEIDKYFPSNHITLELITKTLQNFIGEQEQTPPAYSAKWVNGQRAYNKARKGIALDLKPAIITINRIEVVKFEMPILTIRINCSKGTYIRSLANDIGLALNSGAYLANLRRTKIGNYTIDDAMKVEAFDFHEHVEYQAY